MPIFEVGLFLGDSLVNDLRGVYEINILKTFLKSISGLLRSSLFND